MSERNEVAIADETAKNETAKNETARNEPSRTNGGSRMTLFALLALGMAVAGGGGWAYWELVASHYVETDNAYAALESAQVTAAVAGTIAEVWVKDAQAVKKGDILVVIDPTDARLALAQAEANLKAMRAAVAQARAGRNAALGAKQSNTTLIVSVSLEETPEVALARARRDQAAVDLEQTVIRSPLDGVVARRQVQLGQRVQPSTPLLNVVPVQEMYVDAYFREVQLRDVQPGQKVELSCDLHGDRIVYHGVVEGFSGGTGAAFALIPSQNATGNWIKGVQRLPVRVRRDPVELQAHPLRT